jgi:hypothetical protein
MPDEGMRHAMTFRHSIVALTLAHRYSATKDVSSPVDRHDSHARSEIS